MQGSRMKLVALAAIAVVAGCSAESPEDGETAETGVRAGAPAFPVVLVHAFHASNTGSWSMEPVAAELRRGGAEVYLAKVPSYAGTPARAAALGREIDRIVTLHCTSAFRETPAACRARTKVHLVGHSQGGLDARYVVGKLGYAAKVATVTTLGAPHEGTPLGDVALRVLRDPRARADAPEPSSAFVGEMDALVRSVGGDALDDLKDAFYWLSEARAKNPDDAIPDVAAVHYESWAGVATSDGRLPSLDACEGRTRFPTGRAGELAGLADFVRFETVSAVFGARHQPNDGHIPVVSARYPARSEAKWDFRGCVPADHLDLVGRPEGQQEGNGRKAGVTYRDLLSGYGERVRAYERP